MATIEMSESYTKVEEICRLSEQFKDMELLIIDSGSDPSTAGKWC